MIKQISKGLLIVLVGSFLSQNGIAAEPSAQDIIQKSKEVMSATMVYQVGIASSPATTVVYQKALTNGITVSRFETSAGTVKLTYLFSSDNTFQLFPDAHAAINVSFLAQAGQAPSVNPFARISHDPAEWKGFATYKDKTCFKVQAHLMPMDTNLLAMLPANSPLPDGCLYLIETNTYRVLQTTMLHGASTFGSVEFKNFKSLPDLPVDFFIVPSGYKIENAASSQQYSRLMMKYMVAGPKNVPKGFAFDPETRHIVKVDPKTGAFIPLDTNIVASVIGKSKPRQNSNGYAFDIGYFNPCVSRRRDNTISPKEILLTFLRRKIVSTKKRKAYKQKNKNYENDHNIIKKSNGCTTFHLSYWTPNL